MITVISVYICMCVSSKMMDVCGEAEGRLATELMQHEVQIERDILDPLTQLAEVTTAQLSSYCSDRLLSAFALHVCIFAGYKKNQ